MKFHVWLFAVLKEISSVLLTLPRLCSGLRLPMSVNVLDESKVVRKRSYFSEYIWYSLS